MSTANQTRTAQLLSAQQLREQQETSGREGLESLLKAVRRMLDWLLLPFRMVGRVLFKPRLAAADNSVPASNAAADRAAAPAGAFDDSSLNSLAKGKDADADIGGLVKQISENPDGELDIEVSGKPDDLDAVLPMLMRHIDQILKTHLPSDAQEAQVASRLVALAETAECSRYAHRLVSREVEGAMKAVVADPKYLGLSAQTIEGMIRSAAKSPDAAAQFGDGSAEQRLLARLAVRDKIEADYALQMRQIAVALAPMLGGAKVGSELVGRGKDLLASALQAAEMTKSKFRVRHAVHGAGKDMPETLPAVEEEIDKAIASVASSLEEKPAPAAPAAPAEVQGALEDGLVTDTEDSADFAAFAKADAEAAPAASPAAVPAEPAPAPALAVVAPATKAEVVKAAVVAVQAARSSGGMFGGVATVQRSAAELEAENVVDEVFASEEGENLVGG